MLLLLHPELVQKCFLLGVGWGVGAYLRWTLVQRWAVNRINTVYHTQTSMVHKPDHMHVGNVNR